jgi:hypothetical protein
MELRLLGKGRLLLPALCLALSGCGGIEFQGKIFDYMGLSGNTKREDVLMSDRAPIVIPPDTKRLPAPGAAPIDRADWPVDSDAARKKMVAAKEAKEQEGDKINDPINPYAGKPTLLDKIFARKKTVETPPDVPEPDPTDKTAEDRSREQATASAQKPVDQSLNAPTPPEGEDPFRPVAPKSYESMSNPSGTGIE